MKAQSKKKALELARNHYEHCAKTLKAHETLWQDMWEAQRNPFLRIKEYTSARQKAMRKPVIDAWLKAKRDYEALARSTSNKNAMLD